MLESLKDKRAVFPKNKQRDFLARVESKTQKTESELAPLLNIHSRTLREWKKEKYSIPLKSLKKLCAMTNCSMPSNIVIKEPFWWTKKAAIIGGNATYRKYGIIGGNQELRKKQWRKWWEKKGKHTIKNSKILKRKTIQKPRKSEKLAEFIGIMLGDGGLSHRQINISLHYRDDKPYAKFVATLIKNLFGLNPSIYFRAKKSINTIVVSRTDLVEFLTKNIGLKIGNKIKQQVGIPKWIKQKRQYQIACLRGLIDTDGSIFKHQYKVNKKQYQYKKMDFTSRSFPLLNSVSDILKKLDIKHRKSGAYSIRIESIKAVNRYFDIVGTHNPKHLKKYRK
ncbi:MAG: hypothetical protein AUJ34_01795 [Parcubacteria group bacterium CG1_02_41_12]|nr:MAG: hypothetical protein AUJ34_01795 [Parcubacteria group bacterium CG1_02_41_12]